MFAYVIGRHNRCERANARMAQKCAKKERRRRKPALTPPFYPQPSPLEQLLANVYTEMNDRNENEYGGRGY